MTPLTLLVPQQAAALLIAGDLLASEITQLAAAAGLSIPVIPSTQVLVTSVPLQIGDMNLELTYPRVCLYTSGLKNNHGEKFRSLSGLVTLVVDIWASGNMLTQVDQWLHYYVEAVTRIFRQNTGNWQNGIFFDGSYDLQLNAATPGGLGFLQHAKVTCLLHVSQN